MHYAENTEASATFHAAQSAAREAFEEIEPSEIVLPEAQINTESPLPLFSTHFPFALASQHPIAHKALHGET
jgi:hypothetical protein